MIKTAVIRDNGLVANFFRPSTSGRHPAIIIIGGTGGGLDSTSAVGSLLAERGYTTLALAYFGVEDPPTTSGDTAPSTQKGRCLGQKKLI